MIRGAPWKTGSPRWLPQKQVGRSLEAGGENTASDTCILESSGGQLGAASMVSDSVAQLPPCKVFLGESW